MEYEYLERHNPWWREKDGIEKDFHISKWNSRKYKWSHPFIQEINLDSGSIHIIIGPRQVGKTTAMKLLIKHLLGEGIAPANIFYLRCDEFTEAKELAEAFKIYHMFKEPESQFFIFLDEITNVENWHGFVKNMHDNGELVNIVMFITGSNAVNIGKSSEYLPGRRGKGKNIYFLPLSFREFLKVVEPSIMELLPQLKNFSTEEIKLKTKKALGRKTEIDKAFRKYMACGGFPLPLEDYLINGSVSHDISDVYLSWFNGDVLKSGRSDVIAKQIIRSLIEKAPSAISWENISKDIEVKSPKTVSSYIELFQDLFALGLLYQVDPDRKSANFAKNKKVHFIDPFLYRLFEHWCTIDRKDKDQVLAEGIAAQSLMRFSFRQSGLEKRLNENCFFWKNGFEIDAVVHHGGELFGFAVKWGRARETSGTVGKIRNLIYLTKDEMNFESSMKIPLAIFLSILPDRENV